MHTLESLKQDIRRMGIVARDRLLIHSSMKAVGDVEGGADTVIKAFQQSLDEGLLIFPTHTWESWNNAAGLFDPRTEPSCVGILPEVFRKMPGVIRSLHPTHSVAAWGIGASEFVQGEELFDTPCPRAGCWGRLYDVRAKILFLGASLKTNTFLHSVEEWHNIPDRIAALPTRYRIRNYDGITIEREFHHHSSKYGDPSRHFDKIEELAVEREVIRRGTIGSAPSMICDAVKLADLAGELLEKNPHLFDDDQPVDSSWQRKSSSHT